jgi:hypothetical protein
MELEGLLIAKGLAIEAAECGDPDTDVAESESESGRGSDDGEPGCEKLRPAVMMLKGCC